TNGLSLPTLHYSNRSLQWSSRSPSGIRMVPCKQCELTCSQPISPRIILRRERNIRRL
ncbi:hypothetical protein L9F63_001635, partial [Diploptera punctata]